MAEASTEEEAIVLIDIKEVVKTKVTRDKREGVGVCVEFENDLFDEKGNKIGTCVGTGVLSANGEGEDERFQLFSATDHFEDGSVLWTGPAPHLPAEPTKEHAVQAVGTSGRYLGKKGTRHFQLVDRPDGETTILRSSLFLRG
uniref:[4+2]-cycloaddition catalyzing enzyme n=1 Tax=Streptomyces versipellis TaxID=67375 RepID=A0A0B6VRF8_9ACTN|nr:[4+2]-cycloaddition catalyzing enzyme [Streptomyces versipellis]